MLGTAPVRMKNLSALWMAHDRIVIYFITIIFYRSEILFEFGQMGMRNKHLSETCGPIITLLLSKHFRLQRNGAATC